MHEFVFGLAHIERHFDVAGHNQAVARHLDHLRALAQPFGVARLPHEERFATGFRHFEAKVAERHVARRRRHADRYESQRCHTIHLRGCEWKEMCDEWMRASESERVWRMLRIYATHDDERSNRCVMQSRPPHVFAYDRVACQCWIATMVGSMLCLL